MRKPLQRAKGLVQLTRDLNNPPDYIYPGPIEHDDALAACSRMKPRYDALRGQDALTDDEARELADLDADLVACNTVAGRFVVGEHVAKHVWDRAMAAINRERKR